MVPLILIRRPYIAMQAATMIEDPIVEEIRRYRQEHSAKYDYDLKRICAALRDRQARSNKPVGRVG
jgi:hypothetical protein